MLQGESQKHSVETSPKFLSWYRRTLVSIYAGANWEATTSSSLRLWLTKLSASEDRNQCCQA